MHTEKSGSETHLTKIEARAGSPRKLNRNVLVAGLLLVIAAFAFIVGAGFFETDSSGADELTATNAESAAR